MDPLTLLALANAAVAAVKKGCQLYKDIKGTVGDVKGVLDDLESQFKSLHKEKPPSNESIKKYNAERERIKETAKSDPNDVITNVGQQLGVFFDSYQKIEDLFFQEELESKKVYTGDDSLNKRALQRVLIRTRLERMETELREIMVYETPAELGDLWTRFLKMKQQIEKEQVEARGIQRREYLKKEWERREFIELWRGRMYEIFLVVLLVLYVWSLLWSISLHRENLSDFLSP